MLELDIFTPVRTRLTCLFSMPRLSHEDAKEFVSYRLKLAQADPGLFDDEALECLATDAKGNQRMLMNLAALCLEEAAHRSEKVVSAEITSSVACECQL
jgi:type II secretory pathway predicted ATPase ExeA